MLQTNENVESFNQVPATLLDHESKALFQRLAAEGKDIYAYSPSIPGKWNLWHEGIRFQFVGLGDDGRTLLKRI